MFNTTLTDEYLAIAQAFNLGPAHLQRLVLNAVRAALLPAADRAQMELTSPPSLRCCKRCCRRRG